MTVLQAVGDDMQLYHRNYTDAVLSRPANCSAATARCKACSNTDQATAIRSSAYDSPPPDIFPPRPLYLRRGRLSSSTSTSLPSLLSLSPKSHAAFKRAGSQLNPPASCLHVDSDPHCSYCAADHAGLSSHESGRAAAAAGADTADQLGGVIKNGSATSAPHVRVVQIFNPVLVRTDVANFRSLVQRLTGKSGCSLKYWNKLRRIHAMPVELEEAAVPADHPGAATDYDDADHQAAGCMTTSSTQEQTKGEDELHEERVVSTRVMRSCSAFSELDIHAALVSDGPLPDLTTLPPLLITSSFPSHSLCT